ncbi:HNH endonuclease [Paenibacillus sp. JX-17]|uniref:HNH endonuclease n=1 Tax=Paenibacillus lacisoli TaxID=3064525 RepID=A0ABT9C6I7_9BACL|nr:HNH endonuclease [Paenibacillus sp. JX-17]MDO7904875.1 HNH endonuclease [Paenibacillus sp. JX-17]
MKPNHLQQCELCGRAGVETTLHHLTPKELGGTFLPTANLCIPCHKQIHHLYTNKQLVEQQLNTIEALQHDPAISSFIKWIRKQPAGTIPRSRKSRNVRAKGR